MLITKHRDSKFLMLTQMVQCFSKNLPCESNRSFWKGKKKNPGETLRLSLGWKTGQDLSSLLKREIWSNYLLASAITSQEAMQLMPLYYILIGTISHATWHLQLISPIVQSCCLGKPSSLHAEALLKKNCFIFILFVEAYLRYFNSSGLA